MPRESLSNKKIRANKIEELLYRVYGEGKPSLFFNTPFQLTCAVMLSAQCTDDAVNKVTPKLWQKYPTVADLAAANISDVEDIVHSLGFFRNKAKNLVGMAQMCISEFSGDVPHIMDELEKLPGVGHKTANCVMCAAFGEAEGIAVDTHVFRISHRLGLATSKDNTPEKVEAALMKLYEKDKWIYINHQFVLFGREFCSAKSPKCDICPVAEVCPHLLC